MDIDDVIHTGFSISLACFALMLLPWWLGIAVAAGLGIPWWKKWRFRNVAPSEKRTFFVDNEIFDRKQLMYLGTTQEGTIRWWYMRDGSWRPYMVPQAIDNGKVYWDRKIEIKSPTLVTHLNGFMAMGNEWPEYYKTVIVPSAKNAEKNKSKGRKMAEHVAAMRKKLGENEYSHMINHPTSFDPSAIQAVASQLPRADYASEGRDEKGRLMSARTATAAMASDTPLMELIETVKELEEDATGKCPTLNFEELELK